MPYKDPGEQREYSRKYANRWRAKNPERTRANAVVYRLRNLEKMRKKGRDWYHANIDKERAKDRERSRNRMGVTPTRPEPTHCEICGKSPRHNKALCLDHCHMLERFRGWICTDCNLMLGYARDNPKTLVAAVTYLAEAYK